MINAETFRAENCGLTIIYNKVEIITKATE